jgi:hypothetical protein
MRTIHVSRRKPNGAQKKMNVSVLLLNCTASILGGASPNACHSGPGSNAGNDGLANLHLKFRGMLGRLKKMQSFVALTAPMVTDGLSLHCNCRDGLVFKSRIDGLG